MKTAEELQALVDRARAAFDALTPEQQRAHRREQAISFAWGNCAMMREGPKLTKEQVGALYDEMNLDEDSKQSLEARR